MAATTSEPIEQTQIDRPQPRDFRQEVTDNIVGMLERGVTPWQKPWEANSPGMPFNPTSERAYRGGNAIQLMVSSLERGYQDPRWMTYKQAAGQGWQVRQGEKGTHIEFWESKPASAPSRFESEGDGNTTSAEQTGKSRFIHRVYTVFNAQQIERIPPHISKQRTAFEAVQTGEQILQNSGANIAHDQADQAFYSRSDDSIHLPPMDAFKDAAGYYGTALHELAHWTGHPSRLNRPTLTESYRLGDTSYAREELRAELASVFLAAQRGIPHDPEQHAAYVGSWIAALKRDKNEIFRAAHDASAAADFSLELERDKSIGEEELADGQDLSSPAAKLEQEVETIRRDREAVEEIQHAIPKTPLDTAKTIAANTASGRYRGTIIGETEDHIIQRQSTHTSIAHPKDMLDSRPKIGESVRISYTNSKGRSTNSTTALNRTTLAGNQALPWQKTSRDFTARRANLDISAAMIGERRHSDAFCSLP